jgi:UDP-N-acetyl-D-mannosaminuronic acid dehydrogenase
MRHIVVNVIGLGYIGLPTASVLATRGKKVIGVDVVEKIRETVNRGLIHIHEPDLEAIVKVAVKSGNLRAEDKPAPAGFHIIAVPTPFKVRDDGARAPDLSYVEAATRSLATVVEGGDLIVLESTSPVGTTEKIKNWLEDEVAKIGRAVSGEIMYAHCPERILPGQMLKELVSNDRIAGGLTPEASRKAKELYSCFCTAEIIETDARTAEMVKLTENAFRDVNIAFANELSIVCDKLGINVWELIRLANRHPRVKILQPGPGVGGHCIAVDPWFIVDSAPKEARLMRTAREVNDGKPDWVIGKVRAAAAGLKNPSVACLGLAFKANIDDLRESPSLEIAVHLADSGFGVLAVEPHIRELPAPLKGKGELVDAESAIARSDIVLLLVDHSAFSQINPALLLGKTVIDTRGFFSRS